MRILKLNLRNRANLRTHRKTLSTSYAFLTGGGFYSGAQQTIVRPSGYALVSLDARYSCRHVVDAVAAVTAKRFATRPPSRIRPLRRELCPLQQDPEVPSV